MLSFLELFHLAFLRKAILDPVIILRELTEEVHNMKGYCNEPMPQSIMEYANKTIEIFSSLNKKTEMAQQSINDFYESSEMKKKVQQPIEALAVLWLQKENIRLILSRHKEGIEGFNICYRRFLDKETQITSKLSASDLTYTTALIRNNGLVLEKTKNSFEEIQMVQMSLLRQLKTTHEIFLNTIFVKYKETIAKKALSPIENTFIKSFVAQMAEEGLVPEVYSRNSNKTLTCATQILDRDCNTSRNTARSNLIFSQ